MQITCDGLCADCVIKGKINGGTEIRAPLVCLRLAGSVLALRSEGSAESTEGQMPYLSSVAHSCLVSAAPSSL